MSATASKPFAVHTDNRFLAEERISEAVQGLRDRYSGTPGEHARYRARVFDGDFNAMVQRFSPAVEHREQRRMFMLPTVCGNVEVVDGGVVGTIEITGEVES